MVDRQILAQVEKYIDRLDNGKIDIGQLGCWTSLA